MKLQASIDQKTGCAVLFDEHDDICLLVPNGKTKVTRLGQECDECQDRDLSFIKQVLEAIESRMYLTGQELEVLVEDASSSEELWVICERTDLTDRQRAYVEKLWLDERQTEGLIAQGR